MITFSHCWLTFCFHFQNKVLNIDGVKVKLQVRTVSFPFPFERQLWELLSQLNEVFKFLYSDI